MSGSGANGPDRVGAMLAGLMKKWGIRDGVEEQEVLEDWPEIVGPAISEVTRARAIAQGTLFVEVRSSAWMSELGMLRHELMRRINAGRKAGRVEKIVLLLAENPEFPSRDGDAGPR